MGKKKKKPKKSRDKKRKGNLKNAERIEILLAEYATRQEEKHASSTGITRIVTIAIAVLVGVLAIIYESEVSFLWVFIPGLVLIFMNMEFDRQFTTLYQAMYIRLLEERINRIASEELLTWERYGSGYLTFIGKLFVTHPSKNRRVLNLNTIMMFAYAAIFLAVFVLGMVIGSIWLFENFVLFSSPINAVVIFVIGYLFLSVFIIYNRLFQHDKMLALLEEKLREQLHMDDFQSSL